MQAFQKNTSLIICFFVIICIFIYHCCVSVKYTVNFPLIKSNEQTSLTNQTSKRNPKVLLVYHIPFEWVEFLKYSWNNANTFRDCPISECVLERNKSLLHSSDAVIFKPQFVTTVVRKVKPGQIWIFTDSESPINYYYNNYGILKQYVNVVNWTMTYRRDSDIYIPYGYIKKGPQSNHEHLERMIKNKSKMAVQFNSHCPTKSNRVKYIQKLLSYNVTLDVYGLCGKTVCKLHPRTCTPKTCVTDNIYVAAAGITKTNNSCLNVLNTDYKFILAFENSLCADYVTEKTLHLHLKYNVVPVIRDGAIRSIYHPPGSYIDTKDYSSTKELADHLNYLNQNLTAYRSYLEWRRFYHTEKMGLQDAFCKLCAMVHNQEHNRRIYQNVFDWLYLYADKPACKLAKDIS